MSHYEELRKKDQKIHELEQRIKELEKYIELFPGNIQDKLPVRQQAILEYINNNPGTSKQKIVDKLTEENIASRVTILDGIKDLIENGLVTSRKAKKNSPNYNLYINNNYFKDLINIHNEFERSFIELIDKIKLQIFTNEFVMNFKNDHQTQNQQLIILNVMYNIYSHFMAMVMLHAIFNWPEIIKDEEKRNTLNSILFAKMQKIHKSIYEAFQYKSKEIQISLGIPVFANIILTSFKLKPSYLKSTIEIGKKYNLSPQIEKLLNVVWKVSYPLLPFARPLFEKDEYIESHETKWSKQTWRPINWEEALKYSEKGFLDSELNSIINKGQELINLGKPEEAIKCFDEVLSTDPENLNALNDKGYALNILGKYEEALIYLDKALSINSSYVNALINKGNSLSGLNKHNQAISCYDQVLEIESHNFNALNNKGYLLLLLKDVQQSQIYLDMAFKIEPKNILVLFNIGLLYMEKGDHEGALKWFNELLKINPDYVEGLLKKGYILSIIHKEEEGFSIFKQILEIDPKNVDALTNIGIYLMKHSTKNEDYEEALTSFNKALSIRPDDQEIIINKGILYNMIKKYDEAIRCFDEVLKIIPNDKYVLLLKAETLLDWKQYDESYEIFDKILSLDPSNERAKDGIVKSRESLKK